MPEYRTIPISLSFTNTDWALVVGGGNIAFQKIRWLRSFQLNVEVRSPALIESISSLVQSGQVRWSKGNYEGITNPYIFVIAATADNNVNQQIHQDAISAQVPVNVVDQPQLCDFFVPSTISQGNLHVAVSTNANSPALCARLRKEITHLIPANYDQYTTLLGVAREEVRRRVPDEARRIAIHRYLASAKTASTFGEVDEATREQWFLKCVEEQIATHQKEQNPPGTVYLVGAGPGDCGLLTLKGMRVLVAADAVLHDGLVNPQLLESLDAEVERYDTSKRAGCALHNQEDINALMVSLSLQGKTVCRLKGGDPAVFGRLTSEARALAHHQIPFELVSGVSAAIAALAYAGIPVTDRDCASYFQVVTGHEAAEKTNSRVNWSQVAQSEGTVVFLMGVHRLEGIANQLLGHGCDAETPVAVISKGTLPAQQVFETTLEKAASGKMNWSHVSRPALIVVGKVVQLRQELSWFLPPLQRK